MWRIASYGRVQKNCGFQLDGEGDGVTSRLGSGPRE